MRNRHHICQTHSTTGILILTLIINIFYLNNTACGKLCAPPKYDNSCVELFHLLVTFSCGARLRNGAKTQTVYKRMSLTHLVKLQRPINFISSSALPPRKFLRIQNQFAWSNKIALKSSQNITLFSFTFWNKKSRTFVENAAKAIYTPLVAKSQK